MFIQTHHHHWTLLKAGPSSTAGTVLAVPVFSGGLWKKPDKNGTFKIRYLSKHVHAGLVADSSLAGARFDLLDIPVVPHQPTALEFLKRAFGKMKVVYRAFSSAQVV